MRRTRLGLAIGPLCAAGLVVSAATVAPRAVDAAVEILPVAQDRRAHVAFDCGYPEGIPCGFDFTEAATGFGSYATFLDYSVVSLGDLGFGDPVFGPAFDGCQTTHSEQWVHLVSEIEDDRYFVHGSVYTCSDQEYILAGIPGGPTEVFGDLTFDVEGGIEWGIDSEILQFPGVFCFQGGTACQVDQAEITLRLERLFPLPGVLWEGCFPPARCAAQVHGGTLLPGRYRVVARASIPHLTLARTAGSFSLELRLGAGLAPPPPVPALSGAWGLVLAAGLGASALRRARSTASRSAPSRRATSPAAGGASRPPRAWRS